MKSHGSTLAIAAAFIIGLAGPAAHAAEDPHHPAADAAPAAAAPTGMGSMMGMMGGMGGPGPSRMGGTAIDHIEGRIAFLKAELKIAGGQDAAWNSFAGAIRTNAQQIAKLRADAVAANKTPQTSLARLESREHALSTRLAGVHAITVSYSALYGSLSEEQKKMADTLFESAEGPMRGMMPMARALSR